MLINIGPTPDEICANLMQEALDKLHESLKTNVPQLHGPLAAELNVAPTLLSGRNAHVKTEWATYQAAMVAENNPQQLRQLHADFLKLENI